jgi:signal transduction histidine kinase
MAKAPAARDVDWATVSVQVAIVVAAGVAFAASLVVLQQGEFGLTKAVTADVGLVDVILIGCTVLPVFVSPRWPLAAFLVSASFNVVVVFAVSPLGLPLGPALAIYLLVSREPDTRRRTLIASCITGELVLFVLAATNVEGTFAWVELLHTGLLWGAFWFAGERTRLRREQIADLRCAAERERRLAAAEERARIARDLHDSAGHAINVIAIRAGAARLRHESDPARLHETLAAIEQLARETVADIDRLVGAIRHDAQPSTTPVSVAAANELVDQHRAAGLAVTSKVVGQQRALSPAVDQAAYRITQEALTNASRHGLGSAELRVVYTDSAIELTVRNPTQRNRGQRAIGHGLTGARERAALLGGSLQTSVTDGVHVLVARLPYSPDAAG